MHRHRKLKIYANIIFYKSCMALLPLTYRASLLVTKSTHQNKETNRSMEGGEGVKICIQVQLLISAVHFQQMYSLLL